jgi:hypothetical protein
MSPAIGWTHGLGGACGLYENWYINWGGRSDANAIS